MPSWRGSQWACQPGSLCTLFLRRCCGGFGKREGSRLTIISAPNEATPMKVTTRVSARQLRGLCESFGDAFSTDRISGCGGHDVCALADSLAHQERGNRRCGMGVWTCNAGSDLREIGERDSPASRTSRSDGLHLGL